jgi:acyl dehydratase
MNNRNSADTGVWRDLTDPRRVIDGEDLDQGLKEPDFENLEIPEDLGPVDVLVDDHKIKRFAFVQDDYHPWFLQDSPFGGRIGHAGILGNDLVQLFTTRYAASRVVGLHTEEQLWFDNPVRLDETVTLSGQYTDAYERRGQGYVVMNAQAHGSDGRSIIRHRGIEILRTIPGHVAGRASSQAPAERRVTGDVAAGAPVAHGLLDTPRPGTVLQPLPKIITQEQASVFSRAGEYVRNIHNDLEIARKAGLRRPIVQGQQQIGLLLELLTRTFGAAWFTGGWIRVKFLQTVDVFEPVAASGIITDVTTGSDGTSTAHLDIWVRRADGKLSAAGWASCALPSAGFPASETEKDQSND